MKSIVLSCLLVFAALVIFYILWPKARCTNCGWRGKGSQVDRSNSYDLATCPSCGSYDLTGVLI